MTASDFWGIPDGVGLDNAVVLALDAALGVRADYDELLLALTTGSGRIRPRRKAVVGPAAARGSAPPLPGVGPAAARGLELPEEGDGG